MLDKERMRLYQKERRGRMKGVNLCKPECKPVNLLDVKCKPICKPDVNLPCESCISLRSDLAARDLEIKKLTARVALLEGEKRAFDLRKTTPAEISHEVFTPKYKPLGNSYKPNSLYGA